jgi:hypothetical protein
MTTTREGIMAENYFTKEQAERLLAHYGGPAQMAIAGFAFHRVADALRAAGRDTEAPEYDGLSAQYDRKPEPLAYEDRFSLPDE